MFEFNDHRNLEGLHAPFSPSQSSWLRYDENKAAEVYANRMAAERGTRLHAWAKETIELKIKQPRTKQTLASYVNDAIGFGMTPEVVLFYSPRFFGTADAISFKKDFLRIHDLKTGSVGKIESHLEQLEIYAALFCLEYGKDPMKLQMELRVYKNDDVAIHVPDPGNIRQIMNHIIRLNRMLEKIDNEEA